MPASHTSKSLIRQIPFLGISTYELGSLLIGNGIIFVLFHLLKGQVYFDIVHTLRTFIRFEDPALIIGLLSLLVGVLLTRGERIIPQALLASGICTLILALTTTILEENYAILRGPWVKGMILLGALFAGWFSPKKVLSVVILCSFPIFIGSFLTTLNGSVISSDDHASFIFRFSVLKEHFPSIPFYFPGWNAGLDARDFFATGALNIFFLFFPLIMLGDIIEIYPFIISTILFILLPLSTFLGSRAFGLTRLGALIAASLAVASNLLWYRWALKYGPVGFITSASLLPLIYGFGWNIFYGNGLQSQSKKIIFILASCLALCWAPSSIALTPLLIAAIVSLIITPSRRKELLAIALVIGLIMAPFFIMISAVSNPGKFIQVEKITTAKSFTTETLSESTTTLTASSNHSNVRGKKKPITYERVESNIHDALVSWNYLVLFFAFAGILLFKERSIRRLYYATILILTSLGAAIAIIKPQLELDRMFVILGVLLSIPAAHAAQEVISWWQHKTSILERGAAVLVSGFVIAGIFSVGLVVKNRSLERFYIRSDETDALSTTLKNLPGSGRIFFSGCLLHELDGGHFAPLALTTGKPLVGSAPFHTLWWYTSSIPDHIAKSGEQAISNFLDLYNTDYVIAHEPTWINFFDHHGKDYKHLLQVGKFVIYEKLQRTNSYILDGTVSSLSTTSNSIVFTPTSNDLTLKFRYFPFLQSSSCTLSPKEVAQDLSFIRLEGCTPGEQVTIKSVDPIKRVFIEFSNRKKESR